MGVDAAPDEARHIRAGGAPGAACVLGVRQDTAPAHGGGHAARRMGKRMNMFFCLNCCNNCGKWEGKGVENGACDACNRTSNVVTRPNGDAAAATEEIYVFSKFQIVRHTHVWGHTRA